MLALREQGQTQKEKCCYAITDSEEMEGFVG